MDTGNRDTMYTRFWTAFDVAVAVKRVTVRELSRETGIKYQTIAGWRQHKRLPDLYSAVLIADYLSIPLEVMCMEQEGGLDGLVSLAGRRC